MNHDSYILSFSKNGDSLSQWRAYTPEGGFSIGFPIDRVHSFCKDNGFPDLVKCSYDAEAHNETICNIADSALGNGVAGMDSMAINAVSLKMIDELDGLATEYKHPSFADEQEYRIVAATSNSDRKPDLRYNGKYIIPFTRLNADYLFPRDRETPLIVYFSPGAYSEDYIREISFWIQSFGLAIPEFRESKSPYIN